MQGNKIFYSLTLYMHSYGYRQEIQSLKILVKTPLILSTKKLHRRDTDD